MKFFRFKRRIAVAAVLLFLLLFLVRPGASRLKSRIVTSISAALARPVEISSVHLRLLPHPGFDLENLVVYDDPAFGPEAMLRAPEVTANLRLLSLLRGRLEISRLELSDPSLNLVHGENGRWNLEALLERTSHLPLAPTAKTRSEARPAFPYIQVSSGRINFKNGPEKKPYALINADFALWQESENAWGIRLKAEPFRGDMNLNDTGTLLVNGTWQRAASLRETPVQFSVEWNRPQLGQLSKFVSGEDRGWRGDVQLDATLTGTPANLQVSGDASIRDFRRYDIATVHPSLLAAHCDGRYSSLDHGLHEIFCGAPVGNGRLTLKGELGSLATHHYDLLLSAEGLPAAALVAVVQRAKKSLPDDLEAAGEIRGILAMRRKDTTAAPEFSGTGEITGLHLASASSKAELNVASIPLRLAAEEHVARRPAANARPKLQFGPFAVASGHDASPIARGWISLSDYQLALTGETEVGRMLRLGRLIGLPALTVAAEGQAQIDLQIAGTWHDWIETKTGPSGIPQPGQATGTAALRNLRAEIRGVEGPVEISSARLQLLPDKVRVTKLSMSAAHSVWTGSIELPRGCGLPGACTVKFDMATNSLNLTEIAQWLNPRQKPRPWYRLSETSDHTAPTFLAKLRAEGEIKADRVLVHGVVANHVSTQLSLDAGNLRLSDLRGECLGGKHRGEWTADFAVKPPVYKGSGTFTAIALRQLATAMHDEWIAGTASGSYQLMATGTASSDFWKSAAGTLQFDVRDGSLPHLALAGDEDPVRIDRLQGHASWHDGEIEIKEAALDSSDGQFQLSGSATFTRDLELKLTEMPDASGSAKTYSIGGTLAEPRVKVAANPETQARLKP